MSKKENQTETVETKDINIEDIDVSATENNIYAQQEDQDTDNMSDCSEDVCDKECDKEAELTAQLAEAKDKYARLSAEFDNYRKRTLKEKMDLIDNAAEGVVKSILSVVDDFDRAGVAMQKSDDIESAREGVALMHKRLLDVLKQQNVAEIEALGSILDTDFHDAIAKFPVEEEDKKGNVIDVVEKGYTMKDKVIRFAKVVVGE